MLRAPTRAAIATSASRPAPIGGWNARDSLADMDVRDAVYLDNWFPRNDRLEVRAGFSAYATLTGISTDVETLAAWNGGSTQKLWALGSTGSAVKAFDVSTTGTKSADAGFTGLAHTGAKAQYSQVMFNNVGGYHLALCDENAVNPPADYDGTSWTAPAWSGSGLTITNLVHVNLFKFRLIFCEKGTLNFWYAPQDAIAGALAKFRLGGFCNRGGQLMATGTWTVDAGEGVDDRFVAVTSMGQVIVFTGDDPGNANAWDLMGVYDCAPPIGRRCLFRYGSDLFIITTDGIYSLAALMTQGEQQIAIAVTDKVRQAFQQSARTYRNSFGWQALYYPRGRYMLVNVPQGSAAAGNSMHQYVQNAQTRAWARFKAQNAHCWALLGENLFFGDAGGLVRQADAQTTDAGAGILAQAKQAFDDFADNDPSLHARNKLFTLARPTIETDASIIVVQVGVDVDFQSTNLTPSSSTIGASGATWDVSPWDTTPWDPETVVSSNWDTYGAEGYTAALLFNVLLSNASLAWYATDWVFVPGGIL